MKFAQLSLFLLALSTVSACGRGRRSVNTRAEAVRSETMPDTPDTPGAPEKLACGASLVDFARTIWRPLLREDCHGCHIDGGYAAQHNSKLTFRPEQEPDYLMENARRLRTVEANLLGKVGGTLEHPGGTFYPPDSPQYKLLASFVQEKPDSNACIPAYDLALLDDGGAFVMTPPERLLQKVAVAIVGRLPTAAELTKARSAGMDGVMDALDNILSEEGFYTWLGEAYNDVLFTDYGIHYFGPYVPFRIFPNFYYFERDPPKDPRFAALAPRGAYYGSGREALELIKHVARTNRPFTEILTADYMMTNPMTAPIYTDASLSFKNIYDPSEFIPISIPAMRGHAGILTSFIFLQRFPTTNSNRNRVRAKAFYDIFLDTDIITLGMRNPAGLVDLPDSQSPTMTRPGCVGCHALIDPIASSLQNYGDDGAYHDLPPTGWHKDMRPAGFEGTPVPANSSENPVLWLGQLFANDPRFVRATVKRMYTALIGAPPMREPPPDATDYEEKLRAFITQRQVLAEVGARFVKANYNIKALVKEIVKTPYYRARAIARHAPAYAETLLGDAGRGRQRTPEGLQRAIRASTGIFWLPLLLQGPTDINWIKDRFIGSNGVTNLLLGGMDSNLVKNRATEASAVIAKAQQNLARQIACTSVPHDFALPVNERIMFPYIEADVQPDDPARKGDIIRNIVHLNSILLNESVAPDALEIEQLYTLLVNAWQAGSAWVKTGDKNLAFECQVRTFDYDGRGPGGARGTFLEQLPKDRVFENDKNFVMRAWMAVVASLVSDFRFFYE